MNNWVEMKCSNRDVAFVIDLEDFERVNAYRWWAQSTGVFAYIDKTTVSLSKFLLGITEKGVKVLHRNKNAWDFRKSNLFSGNIYHDRGDCYEVECFDGQTFLISKDSYHKVKPFIWHIDKNQYAITKLKTGRVIKLHRLLLEVIDDASVEVDHINRDTRDNRISNLRLADRSLNCFNRDVQKYNKSGVIGVYRMSGYDNKWCAQINANGHKYYLGSFDSIDEAADARRSAELQYFG